MIELFESRLTKPADHAEAARAKHQCRALNASRARLRSAVSAPSSNQRQIGSSSARASSGLPCIRQSSARLVVARNSRDLAPWPRATPMDFSRCNAGSRTFIGLSTRRICARCRCNSASHDLPVTSLILARSASTIDSARSFSPSLAYISASQLSIIGSMKPTPLRRASSIPNAISARPSSTRPSSPIARPREILDKIMYSENRCSCDISKLLSALSRARAASPRRRCTTEVM